MGTLLRALNTTGIERFQGYLTDLRDGTPGDPPWELLEEMGCTAELPVDMMIEPPNFPNRLALGEYLCDVLAPLRPEETDRNTGLWAWLSLFLFDQVCPTGKHPIRRPGSDYRHIPDFGYRTRHRHLLYGPYQVYRRHGHSSILLLSGPVHSESRIYHDIAGRQDLIANRGVVEATAMLYLDRARGVPKQGAQAETASPGTIRRFVRVLQQLDVNYDIYGMSGKDIVTLLPSEFDAWRKQKRTRRASRS